MTRIKVPCYNCSNRQLNCHASCKDYKTFVRENDERSDLIRQKKAEESAIADIQFTPMQKYKHKKGLNL